MFHARIDDSPETVCKELEEMDRHASLQLEQDYFKQYEWLNADHFARPPSKELMLRNVFLPFLQATMGVDMSKEAPSTQNPEQDKLYMYFISLEQDKMFLYVDFQDQEENILIKAREKYQYVQAFAPIKIVFVMEIKDLYDVDKHVKQFMHMFGIDNTRGGSYINIKLKEEEIQLIEKERAITSLDYYGSGSSSANSACSS